MHPTDNTTCTVYQKSFIRLSKFLLSVWRIFTFKEPSKRKKEKTILCEESKLKESENKWENKGKIKEIKEYIKEKPKKEEKELKYVL